LVGASVAPLLRDKEMLLKIIAFISTVALLVWMGYFMLGCLPLLILKHDTSTDSRFVRGFFNVHYLVLMAIATVGALSWALSDRRFIALVMACIAFIAVVARRGFVARMDRMRSTMTATDPVAIRGFRRLHIAGIVLNVVLLIGFGLAITRIEF
jgi:hypothetical protein